MSIIKNLVRKKTSFNNKNPTALCFFYDGRFDNQLAETGLKLIGCIDNSIYSWSPLIKSKNIELIKLHEINNYTYDFVICNDIIRQKELLINYTRFLHLPGLIINHEPFPQTQYHLQVHLQEMNAGLISTEMAQPEHVLYGIKEPVNISKDIEILVEGNFQQRDYQMVTTLKREIPQLTLIGHNPGLDFSIEPTSFEEYKKYFARCKTFINLPTQNSISHQLLWSMSNGAHIISLKTPIVTQILNSQNSTLCSNPNELIVAAKRHLSNTNKLSNKVPEFLKDFSFSTFNEKWKSITKEYVDKVYKHE